MLKRNTRKVTVISDKPRFRSPVALGVAMIGIDREVAMDKIIKAWKNPKCINYDHRILPTSYFVELELPKLQFIVEVPFQGLPILTVEALPETAVYYLTLSWVMTVISGMPHHERSSIPDTLKYMDKLGFIIRRAEELN